MPKTPGSNTTSASLLPPLGAHMSIAGGTPRAIERARSVGSTAFQLFLKNNNQWRGKPLAPPEIDAFHTEMAKGDLAPPVAHASYLINLASQKDEISEKSVAAMADELERARLLGVPGVVVHPGAPWTGGAGRVGPDCPACQSHL